MSSNLDRTCRIDGVRSARRKSGVPRGVIARRLWPMLAAAGLVIAVLGQACSSGSSTKNATATAGVAAELTAATGAPTPGPSPTPVDPSTTSYQPDTGPSDTYRIDVPSGWQHEDPAAPGGYQRRYYYAVGDVRQAAIAVWCQPGRSIDQMMSEDNLAVGGRKGQYGIGAASSITIAGLNGRVVDYDVSPAGVQIEARTVYLASNPCGWRIVLYAYSQGGRDRWARLFERVAQSFQETSSPPPG